MKRSNRKFSLSVMFVVSLLIAGAAYVYTSAIFERTPPEIKLDTNGYWNLKDPLKLTINDASGLKFYKVTLQGQSFETGLSSERFMEPKSSVNYEVKAPANAYTISDKVLKIKVEAIDASRWNFFNGNIAIKEFELKIDKKRPFLNVIGNSYKISKGGSALVIFKATDENLRNIFIEVGEKRFKAEPFYKEGYYISLLAWSIQENNFRATIVAEDGAGNISQSYVPLYLMHKDYKVSNMKISDNFLKGKIYELAGEFEETQGIGDPLQQFKAINETIRAKNEALIHKITSEVPSEMINDFHVEIMYPLKNAQVVAHFGDHRLYSYDGKALSESYHMGLDLASNALADITPQNGGEVVFADYNGLYGNMPIISHGLGLYTLYGHCSKLNVTRGERIIPKTVIANTGKSGYAMGDHLHFGVLVQGIEVRPQEWMDKTWIKLNITDVIENAKLTIEKS